MGLPLRMIRFEGPATSKAFHYATRWTYQYIVTSPPTGEINDRPRWKSSHDRITWPALLHCSPVRREIRDTIIRFLSDFKEEGKANNPRTDTCQFASNEWLNFRKIVLFFAPADLDEYSSESCPRAGGGHSFAIQLMLRCRSNVFSLLSSTGNPVPDAIQAWFVRDVCGNPKSAKITYIYVKQKISHRLLFHL